MKRSEERILTTHAGALPKSAALLETLTKVTAAKDELREGLLSTLQNAVTDSVTKQIRVGLDVVNDGEQAKTNFGGYVGSRLCGMEFRGESKTRRRPASRDSLNFPEYYATRPQSRPVFGCVGAIRYIGSSEVAQDIDRLKKALGINGMQPEDAFLSAISPGNLEHWIDNEFYPDQEAFLFALADALHEEYVAIVESGLLLQIDNPDVLNGFGVEAHLDLGEYLKYAEIRVEALNQALRGIPADRVRMHACWGSFKGPHSADIPLIDVIDLVYRTNVACIGIEAATPRHEHEWAVFERKPLPKEKILMPGVIGHATDTIEHPELIAQRLERYAKVVGRENVIASSDCGYANFRIGHPSIGWAKLQALSEGAQIASHRLWR